MSACHGGASRPEAGTEEINRYHIACNAFKFVKELFGFERTCQYPVVTLNHPIQCQIAEHLQSVDNFWKHVS
ncbi:unnamed protein product, partial [Urochloa humidicola]